jgi:[protein-PII] uridylyltransferase
MQSVQEELKESRERLIASFRDGGASSEFQARYTEMVDHYFRRSLEESRAGRRLFRARKPFSLVAVGGYGRGDLCLASDIDLLLLFSTRVPRDAKPLVEEILFPLWDQGLDLGYAVRSLKECVRLAGADFEVLTSLLDARFVGGDSPLFLKLLERVHGEVVAKKRERFARWLEETDSLRMETVGDASRLLEPDLKRGIGGLRDIHHMAWLSRARFGLESLRDLETTGRLSHPEHRDLQEAASLIHRVRNHLHDLSGRKNDRLTFEHQPAIAARLGYRDRPHFPAVEQFMGDLHAAMEIVKALGRVVSAIPSRGTVLTEEAVPEGFPPGLTTRGGEIGFQSAAAVLEDPLLMMRAFAASAGTGAPLSLETLRLVREFLPLVDDPFRVSDAAARGFGEVLRSNRAADTLDQMFETRFLDAYIPELGAVRDRVQFDTYHLYPVGRHCLETVRTLERVARQEEILLAGIYLDLAKPERLLLAALLHDIGKSARDHARHGAAIAGPLLRRLGLDPGDAEEVVFLIRNHLLLVETATRRDLGDEKIVVGCARRVGTIERLKLLYLLTWADARATGPRAWNDWVASLVQELFFKVLHILERGELASPDASKRMDEVRRKVRQATLGRIEEDLLHRAFEVMTPRYLLNTAPEAMARHVQLFGRLKASGAGRDPAGFVADPRPDPARRWWEVSFLARDRPGLFSLIAGVLALNGINILSSEIYTWRDQTAVDLFRVMLPDAGRPPEEMWSKVDQDLKGALAGRFSPAERLERKAAPSILSRPGRPHRPVEVRIDNEASDFFTLVDVFADDRVGLLYDITRTLTDLGLDIRIAKISTKGDQVADAFYVRDLEGQKVEDPERLRRMEKELFLGLDQGKRAGRSGAA